MIHLSVFFLTFFSISISSEVGVEKQYFENMIIIPKSEFLSGKPNTPKPFTLETFYIDRYEVTQTDYLKVMGKNPSYFKGEGHPVEKITWFSAKKFCEKIGKRLPTEWEWEKAAKGGTNTRFYWGEKMDDRFAWYKNNSNQQTHSVGKTKPNNYGLFDMSGNVWEWTSSDHETSGKVLRGGSWRNEAVSQQSAYRISSLPVFHYHYMGFRCAASSSPKL